MPDFEKALVEYVAKLVAHPVGRKKLKKYILVVCP